MTGSRQGAGARGWWGGWGDSRRQPRLVPTSALQRALLRSFLDSEELIFWLTPGAGSGGKQKFVHGMINEHPTLLTDLRDIHLARLVAISGPILIQM